ncbi:MAG: transcriptional repressor NrdR [Verrucomicrobia bacterium]|nr:transcriptional repressor NrdR [Verrucomicrobiota bacterium]
MRCPRCKHPEDKVTDSRSSREDTVIRRRRECLKCGFRYTTYEKIEQEDLLVIKADGRREAFSRDKLRSGIVKACQKRPVSSDQIENEVEAIIQDLYIRGGNEIAASELGEIVMERLKKLDPVAYIRFASVYRRFREVSDFVSAAKNFDNKEEEKTEPKSSSASEQEDK